MQLVTALKRMTDAGEVVRRSPAAPSGVRLDLVRAFVALAEERSFTRAAARLYMSQPGVSRQVGQLEAVLGQALAVRAPRDITLTRAGAALLPHARALLAAADDAAEAVRAAGTERLHALPAQRAGDRR